jgi:hypothetical protein
VKDAVDVSGLPSVQRILLIRDITKRLREVDDKREKDQKIFTGNAFTEIFFKLDSTKFSFRLHPSNNQPGNGFLSMKGTGRTYEDSHWKMEKYYLCFTKLRAKVIDSVVTRARRRGTNISVKDLDKLIDNLLLKKEKRNSIKKHIAEELTYFMLKYDFEIACRLQRPYVNYSHFYDELPIGIGIALMHRINSRNINESWEFYSTRDQEIEGVVENSGLFEFNKTRRPSGSSTGQSDGTFVNREKIIIGTKANADKRKHVLLCILAEFKQLNINKSNQVWTKEDYIKILYKQFGVTTVQAIPQSKPHSSSLAAKKKH